MLPHPRDTIVALSSAPGPGARAIVRLSGPEAFAVTSTLFTQTSRGPTGTVTVRRRLEGQIHLPGIASPLPADVYVWPQPRTYTGQDLAELHTIACPPLVDLLVGHLLNAGARAAQPGEFTLRAFLAGKLDLTRAEAVLGVIEAGSRDDLKLALGQLAGGVARPLQELREDLLNLLAEVEAGLDFAEEDIRFVGQDELLTRLAGALAQLTLLRKQLDTRALSNRPFRAVLAGKPNSGKSSLFNALVGDSTALVSPEPGTTRDYLVHTLELDGIAIELVDTAGWRNEQDTIEKQAQALGREQAERADLVIMCLEAGKPAADQETLPLARGRLPPVLLLSTKCDLADPPSGLHGTSARSGVGIDHLRDVLCDRARAHNKSSLAPSLSRCTHHVDACLDHLRRAHAVVLYQDPPELLALELRGALDELGEMVGAVYTDDLLDRIFSRFCIGK